MNIVDQNGGLSPELNPFDDDHVRKILGAVSLAWSMMKAASRNQIEDKITFALAAKLQNDPSFRGLPFDVVPQYNLLDADGNILGRLDLYIKYRSSQRAYFAFEAKRLHVRYPGGKFSYEYSVYVGEEGMGAFIASTYSKGLPSSGMLGYVMDGNTETAWFGLAQEIEPQWETLKLRPLTKFADSPLAPIVACGLKETRLAETAHLLEAQIFRLFHLLLPVPVIVEVGNSGAAPPSRRRRRRRQARPSVEN